MRLSDLPGCWLVDLFGKAMPIKMSDASLYLGIDARMTYSKEARRHFMVPKNQPNTKFIIWPKECFHEF